MQTFAKYDHESCYSILAFLTVDDGGISCIVLALKVEVETTIKLSRLRLRPIIVIAKTLSYGERE